MSARMRLRRQANDMSVRQDMWAAQRDAANADHTFVADVNDSSTDTGLTKAGTSLIGRKQSVYMTEHIDLNHM
jgi:hypothetical protein